MTASVADWLRSETQHHLQLLTKLRTKLERSLEPRPDVDPVTGAARLDEAGHPLVIAPDLNERGTPSRDWCRAMARYQSGWTTLLTEERERWKLRLLSQRAGLEVLDDAEFERGMRELAAEALHQLSPEELEAELAIRRQAVAALAAGDPDAR